eukprot:CAMPEP_0201595022 /NCGR_PEP_ID=MMETSP0190_2-20130828/192162_1 /ASSEMBLY_ACC=CAM_ASM_000263 /TAXON_ID=37353 /ORGANISM="Rosalina sp." /LENGTH=655 /DNA_ID=CAMNT_0048054865 /DNA_START=50 /DNA_END=2017 /DNA_ORIENTATION=-
MISWFGSSSTVLTLTIKTTNGELEDTVQIQSDESVSSLKTLIDEKFQCDPDLQKLVYQGQILKDDTNLPDYNIADKSIILLMNANDQQKPKQSKQKSKSKKSIYDKSNPYYQSQSELSQPGKAPNNDNDENTEENKEDDKPPGPYFDPILNKLATYHPELPMAVMEHSKEIGDLMQDLNRRFQKGTDENGKPLSQEEQSLAAYYYYLSLSLGSLASVTSTVATTVYEHLPTKEQLASAANTVRTSIISDDTPDGSNKDPNAPQQPNKASMAMGSMMRHLQKLVTNTKAEKEAIDRLVSLGFGKTESVEAYLACDKDEALAAVFLSQERKTQKPSPGGPGQFLEDPEEEEEKKDSNKPASNDASAGYINQKHEFKKSPIKSPKINTNTKGGFGYPSMMEEYDKTIINNSVYFKQFQKWIRNVFENDELYYRYLLLFMKEKIADMTCLEDINYDEEYLINIGIEHRIHRKRIIKAIGLFVTNKNKFELWWNETIQYKKYLRLFQKNNVWDLEELLLQIRNKQDVINKIGIDNENDVDMIIKHVGNLRNQHTLYSNIQATGSILTPNMMSNAYNPNAMHSMQPTVPHAMPSIPVQQYPNNNIPSQPHNMNYSAPPMYPDIAPPNNKNNPAVNANANANASNMSIQSNNSQQEGAVTQM